VGSTAGLAPGFRERVEGLLAASHGRVTVSSGFRTKSQQIALRKKNCPDWQNSPSSACHPPTAKPGTSQHEKGLAVDLDGDLVLAAKLAPQFGLRQTVAGEPWHFEGPGGNAGVDPQSGNPAVTAIAGAGGDDDGIIDNLIDGFRRIVVTGLVVAGGAALLAAGAYRATTGRSLAAATAKRGAGAVKKAAAVAAVA
jgi:hypothetical protein